VARRLSGSLLALLPVQREASVVFMSKHDRAFADAIGTAVVEFETLTDH
jgi:hypothetical protein